MAIALSAEDKRIIADIERQLAERKKAMRYYELAAMNGHSKARHNLGNN